MVTPANLLQTALSPGTGQIADTRVGNGLGIDAIADSLIQIGTKRDQKRRQRILSKIFSESITRFDESRFQIEDELREEALTGDLYFTEFSRRLSERSSEILGSIEDEDARDLVTEQINQESRRLLVNARTTGNRLETEELLVTQDNQLDRQLNLLLRADNTEEIGVLVDRLETIVRNTSASLGLSKEQTELSVRQKIEPLLFRKFESDLERDLNFTEQNLEDGVYNLSENQLVEANKLVERQREIEEQKRLQALNELYSENVDKFFRFAKTSNDFRVILNNIDLPMFEEINEARKTSDFLRAEALLEKILEEERRRAFALDVMAGKQFVVPGSTLSQDVANRIFTESSLNGVSSPNLVPDIVRITGSIPQPITDTLLSVFQRQDLSSEDLQSAGILFNAIREANPAVINDIKHPNIEFLRLFTSLERSGLGTEKAANQVLSLRNQFANNPNSVIELREFLKRPEIKESIRQRLEKKADISLPLMEKDLLTQIESNILIGLSGGIKNFDPEASIDAAIDRLLNSKEGYGISTLVNSDGSRQLTQFVPERIIGNDVDPEFIREVILNNIEEAIPNIREVTTFDSSQIPLIGPGSELAAVFFKSRKHTRITVPYRLVPNAQTPSTKRWFIEIVDPDTGFFTPLTHLDEPLAFQWTEEDQQAWRNRVIEENSRAKRNAEEILDRERKKIEFLKRLDELPFPSRRLSKPPSPPERLSKPPSLEGRLSELPSPPGKLSELTSPLSNTEIFR